MRIKTLFTGFCCGIILAPAMALAADTAPAPKAKQTVADTPFVIVAPSEEIVVTFPLFVVERGVVESVDAKNGTFTIKDKQLVSIELGEGKENMFMTEDQFNELVNQLIEGQTMNIDGISGATVDSQAIVGGLMTAFGKKTS